MSVLRKIPAPAIILAIWFLSSLSSLPLPPTGPFAADKLAHAVAYASLAFAVALWFPRALWNRFPWRLAASAVLFAALYGAVDEFHQSFVPGRDVSFFDWLADVAGAFIGTGLHALVARKRVGGPPVAQAPGSSRP